MERVSGLSITVFIFVSVNVCRFHALSIPMSIIPLPLIHFCHSNQKTPDQWGNMGLWFSIPTSELQLHSSLLQAACGRHIEEDIVALGNMSESQS